MDICINQAKLMEDWEQLHRIPEVDFHEHRTSAYLRGRLEEMGYGVQPIAGTGLRADMDALEFSNTDGSTTLLHACGHDAHCAMVLAAGV